jgi:FkbM family methyltransferase
MSKEEEKQGREWFSHERRIFCHLKEVGFRPNAIFDVGSAHAGWSWIISHVFPDANYYLFEPLVDYKPPYSHFCEQTLSQRPNFFLHKIALGDRNGQVQLFSDPEGHAASVIPTEPNAWLPESVEVQMATLESYIRENSLPKPDILKIDVQGAEMLILQGARKILPEIKIIQAET